MHTDGAATRWYCGGEIPARGQRASHSVLAVRDQIRIVLESVGRSPTLAHPAAPRATSVTKMSSVTSVDKTNKNWLPGDVLSGTDKLLPG